VLRAGAIVGALIGLAFGVQAAILRLPSHAQLVAVEALKELSRYQAMSSTERISAGPLRTVCLESPVYDAKVDTFVLGSFVVVGGGQRYYDLGHGIHTIGGAKSKYIVVWNRFLLAGCPGFLAKRLGTILSDRRLVRVTPAQGDGVAAFRIEFGRARTGVVLYVERRGLRPLGLALGSEASAPNSDIEPTLGRGQDDAIDRIVPTALRRRLHLG
jgi:hypothetical protein